MVRWAEHVANIGIRNACTVLSESLLEGRIFLEDADTDRFLWVRRGTSGEFFAKNERDIRIS
jgi:hypothetical protein